jgi:hypothetical protein
VSEVLTARSEGLASVAAVRVFGHRYASITTWLRRAGEHSPTLHDRVFQHLHLPHIQVDEIRTRLRRQAHTLWLWVALDPISTIIPVLDLGSRTQDAAHAVIHELGGKHVPSCILAFTSDGLNLYFYARSAHLGQWVAALGRRKGQWQVAAELIYGELKSRCVCCSHSTGTGWEAHPLTLSPANTGYGRRTDKPALECTRTARRSAAAGADWRWVKRRGVEADGSHRSVAGVVAGSLGGRSVGVDTGFV